MKLLSRRLFLRCSMMTRVCMLNCSLWASCGWFTLHHCRWAEREFRLLSSASTFSAKVEQQPHFQPFCYALFMLDENVDSAPTGFCWHHGTGESLVVTSPISHRLIKQCNNWNRWWFSLLIDYWWSLIDGIYCPWLKYRK